MIPVQKCGFVVIHVTSSAYVKSKNICPKTTGLSRFLQVIFISLRDFRKYPFVPIYFFPSQRLNLMSHSSIVGCCSDIMTVSGTGTLAGGNEAILSDANTEDLVSASELLAIWVTGSDFFFLCFSTILLPSSQALCANCFYRTHLALYELC